MLPLEPPPLGAAEKGTETKERIDALICIINKRQPKLGK